MDFEPIGGFPPIIIIDEENIKEKTLESRGFATTNIVSIGNIMQSEKKKDLFLAFGSEEEDGYNFLIEEMLDKKPHEYKDIKFENISKDRKKIN